MVLAALDLEQFYLEHQGFIKRCAGKVARKYGCSNILEDLISAGTIAALEQIGRYDETQGAAMTTFLHHWVVGAMKREAEQYLGLSRRGARKHPTAGAFATANGVSLDEVDWGDIPSDEESIDQQVYIKICIEHLREAFDGLSFKERTILGGFFGVYGHKKETLAEIGEAFQIGENAALKAKDKALEKLRGICLEGELGYWRSVRRAIREAQRECVVGHERSTRFLFVVQDKEFMAEP